MAVVEIGEQAALFWGDLPRSQIKPVATAAPTEASEAEPIMAFSSCGSCKRSSAWKHGFARCSLMKTYEYMPEAAKCYFSPSKYDPRK